MATTVPTTKAMWCHWPSATEPPLRPRAVPDEVGVVAEIPGAHLAVEEKYIPPVERAGDVFVDQAHFARGLRGLDPRRHRELTGVVRSVVRGKDVIVHAIKADRKRPIRRAHMGRDREEQAGQRCTYQRAKGASAMEEEGLLHEL